MTFANWVHRRVERFEFIDAETVRRHMSVDLTLPAETGMREGQVVAVPLMLHKKRIKILRSLDVADASGRSLNVLESERTRRVMIEGLRVFIARLGGSAPPEAMSALEAIVKGEPGPAREEVELALGENGAIDAALSDDDTAAVEAIRALIQELAEGFTLLVALPYSPGTPQLLKFSFDEPRVPPMQVEGEVRIARKRQTLNRALSTLGLTGRVESVWGLPVRLGASYHAEVLPAPGTYSGEARLLIREASEEVGGNPVSRQAVIREGVCRDAHRTRPHLWVGGSGRGTNRGELGDLQVVLYARRDGLVFPLFFSAAVIAGVLAWIPLQHSHLDGITLGALLLAPVALAAYYARSDENDYLTVAMRGLRGVATISVIAGVAVIGLLGLGYIHPHAGESSKALENSSAIDVARWAGRAALVCAIELGLAVVAPTVAEGARRAFGGKHKAACHRAGKREELRDFATVTLPALILVAAGAILALWMFALLPI
ncbi:MAG TPA: hypothetical protein VFI17_07330 [Solirubrobacterales bacterium]|nr:hypothetical protein [Solirubrobacterales bacterium]